MSQTSLHTFAQTADTLRIRNRSILDTLTKLATTGGRVQRATAKAVTHCGCLRICAQKQDFTLPEDAPEDRRWELLCARMDTHLSGRLCENCRDILSLEIGEHLFYLAGLCSVLGLDLPTILENEQQRLQTLGAFNLR